MKCCAPRRRSAPESAFGLFIGGAWVPRPGVHRREQSIRRSPGSDDRGGRGRGRRRAVARPKPRCARSFPRTHATTCLMRGGDRIEAQQDDYASTIAREGSKTIREARREPLRAATILRLAAEEGRRLAGETLPFDSRVGSEHRVGYYFRFPVGIVAAIAPFNDPLTVVAHKVGPALAAGNAVVLKPASATPLSALRRTASSQRGPAARPPQRGHRIGRGRRRRACRPSARPDGDLHWRRCRRRADRTRRRNQEAVAGARFELAGHRPGGRRSRPRRSGDRRPGAFAQAGQNCLGVQRVFVHESVYDTSDAVCRARRAVEGRMRRSTRPSMCAR